jgi:hypothetical protein
MFGRRRLAKEEYALMGGNPVWSLSDAVNLLTSFEMEVMGAFGESGELIEITSLDIEEFTPGVIGIYSELSSKWIKCLHIALWDGDILYANMPERDDVPFDLPEGAGRTITGTGSFTRDELLTFIALSIHEEKIALDLKLLCDFLNGKGTAPARGVRVVEVEKIVERERVVEIFTDVVKIEKVPPTREEIFSAAASNIAQLRHSQNTPFKNELADRIKDYFSGDCHCTSKSAFEAIKNQWPDEDAMKADVKVGYYTLNEKIKDALVELEKADPEGIVRRNQAKGYSKEKTPTSCPKHKKTILK